MSRKLTKELFLKRAKEVHGNVYQYPGKYIDFHTKIGIICPTHGPFPQTPAKHLNGQGCKKCAAIQRGKAQSSDKKTFLHKARKVHGTRYQYPGDYVNSTTKMKIICADHGLFPQTPANHLMGNGCPKCGGTLKLTKNTFVKKANEVHGNRYQYPGEYVNAKTKVAIVCPEHGLFPQTPDSHLSGCGCPKCGAVKKAKARASDMEAFLLDARKLHGDVYEYRGDYVNAVTKLEIICPIHGPFRQTPNKHLGGQGCRKCGTERTTQAQTSNIEEFLAKAKKIHGDRYQYPGAYVGATIVIEIVCTKHGPFSQTPHKHLSGHGCLRCVSQISRPETQWLDSLNIPGLLRQHSIRIQGVNKPIRADGYDRSTGTIYLFHGDYFHGNPKVFDPLMLNMKVKRTHGDLYLETKQQEALMQKAGYNLVVMWEYDWKVYLRRHRQAA